MNRALAPREARRELKYPSRIVAAVVAVTVLAGCSKGSSDSAQKSLSDLLPARSEFTAFEYQPIPSVTAEAFGQQLTEALGETVYDPPQCKRPREEQAKLDSHMQRVGMRVNDKPEHISTRFYVTKGGESAELVKQMFLGECATVKMDRTPKTGEFPDSTTLRTKETPAPTGTRAHLIDVFQQNMSVVTSSPGDEPIDSTALIGYAQVGDVTVVVQQTTYDLQREPDFDRFNDYFKKAIAAAA